MPGPSQRPWPIVGCSLAACLLIGLVYFLQSSIVLVPLILPGRHHQNIQEHEAITARPRIDLHPEDHVYRPAATQYLDWRVTSDFRRPDGVLKRVYLINGLFPGPTVEARSGDTLIITVTNALPDESISIHWHGLHVANAMDGAVGISQCPVPSGGHFVYNLTIPSDQSGTFWYHAHSGVSRADGLYGGLVVHAPTSKSATQGLISRRRDNAHRYTYDRELLLLIGDWYHRPARDVLGWYMDPGNFGNEPVPDSLLINGAGYFDCMMAVPARPVDCIDQQVNNSFIDLDPHATYRIRVVNTGALAGLSLVFDNHLLDLLQVDSVDVARSKEKNVNSIGILFPGQRMDFVLRPSLQTSEKKQSHMRVQLDQDGFKYANPALMPNQTFPINCRSDAVVRPPLKAHHLNIGEVPSAPSILRSIPPAAQQTHVVYTKVQKLARYSNKPFGYFNQTTWKPQQDPPVPLASIPRAKWDVNQFAITTGPEPVWIDLVINNLDEGSHPFHLHGHHFYILAVHQAEFGWGSYNPFIDKTPPHLESDSDEVKGDTVDAHKLNVYNSGLYDTSRAALRDTVQIPSRGYAVLRFQANNPGVWLFHCHMLWHSATGMAMLIDVQGDPTGLAAHADGGESCPAF
ncbi:hypothetical protein N7527_001586 [Penicillium freii]|uniref:Laccase n=1 Tax=Penicillium freii TaxID=48697 RepID=A0A117NRG3_PENFR|nr:hypothetical protein N7527_001586 [Penicillium freii]KUM65482.1 hypothetical protein ACN42_g1600 [Penicillium freii]